MTRARVDPIADREYHKVAPVPDTGRPSIYDFRRFKAEQAGSRSVTGSVPMSMHDSVSWLLDEHVALPVCARVLDAGSGPGLYVPAVRERIGPAGTLVALDLARGRLAMIDPRLAVRIVGDVTELPFPDASFDVVLAMHMLYHVPEIPRAVTELRRVLCSGGALYALTDSEYAHAELLDLYLRHGGGDPHAYNSPRFTSESGGAVLATAFSDAEIELREFSASELVITDAECIVDEFDRLRYTLEPGLRIGVTWEDLLAGVRREAADVVARMGAFHVSERHGMFVCTSK